MPLDCLASMVHGASTESVPTPSQHHREVQDEGQIVESKFEVIRAGIKSDGNERCGVSNSINENTRAILLSQMKSVEVGCADHSTFRVSERALLGTKEINDALGNGTLDGDVSDNGSPHFELERNQIPDYWRLGKKLLSEEYEKGSQSASNRKSVGVSGPQADFPRCLMATGRPLKWSAEENFLDLMKEDLELVIGEDRKFITQQVDEEVNSANTSFCEDFAMVSLKNKLLTSIASVVKHEVGAAVKRALTGPVNDADDQITGFASSLREYVKESLNIFFQRISSALPTPAQEGREQELRAISGQRRALDLEVESLRRQRVGRDQHTRRTESFKQQTSRVRKCSVEEVVPALKGSAKVMSKKSENDEMMGTSHHLDQASSHLNNLRKRTRPHDDLGSDLDDCPLFDNTNPRTKFCRPCGSHMRFLDEINPDLREAGTSVVLEPKHKIFLSHSGQEKAFAEHLRMDLESFDRHAFFGRNHYSQPVGENFPRLIIEAIRQCHVGVVILSEDFFISKWPMMELVAMVAEAKERGSSFRIIPVFLQSSFDNIRGDSSKIIEWKCLWDKWAFEKLGRINNAEFMLERMNSAEFMAALKYLRITNGLTGLAYGILGEVGVRKLITEAICDVVPPEIRFEVSFIQGKSRLCEVIRRKFINVRQEYDGVRVMGLYGVGGIGKTSICKALCNELSGDFKGKVCHTELERKSEKVLLQEALERLTDINPKLFHGLSISELEDLLKRGLKKQPVFLALDNVSDSVSSLMEADRYLSRSLMPGSIVIVTARSLGTLLRMKPYLDRSNCMEMPELEIEEAKAIFIQSSRFDVCNEMDERLIMRYIERCRFQKGIGNNEYHYHPLALVGLGMQLRGFDLEVCGGLLDKINEDIFNSSREDKHPIFSILRTSYDTLSAEDQLLFMDIALYLPTVGRIDLKLLSDVVEWLGVVHRIASADVKRRLETLKRKSLLESVGDGMNTRIGMHDLWREFSVAEVAEAGHEEMSCRRWVYLRQGRDELLHTSASGKWEKVKRMAILGFDGAWGSPEGVEFNQFPNVTVLKLSGLQAERFELNVSGMVHLKSLEVRGEHLRSLILHGLTRDLQYLGSEALEPFCFFLNVECCVPGFCTSPRTSYVSSPINIRKLHLFHYPKRYGSRFKTLSPKSILELEMFPELSDLHLGGCGGLGALSSSVPLKCLTELDILYCWSLEALPDLGMFPALRSLRLLGCPVRVLSSSVLLTYLSELVVRECKSLESLPDLGMFPALSIANLEGCSNLRALSSSVSLTSLSELDVRECKSLESLPDLGMFRALSIVNLEGCSNLRALSSSVPLTSLSELDVRECKSLEALSDLGMFPALSIVNLEGCSELRALSSRVPLTSLIKLNVGRCRSLKALPDLAMFPALSIVNLEGCSELRALSSRVPLISLSELDARECKSLESLPDLGMFPALSILNLEGCSELRVLSSIGSGLETARISDWGGLETARLSDWEAW